MGDYIAQDNPAAAEQWVEALLELAERAARLPRSGRRVPEMGRDDVRELILGSYRLVYRLVDELIDVLAVFEGHRRLPAYVVEAEAEEPSGR